jgi:sulfoxide reductase heme-binding subunit YedZ
VIDPTPYLFWIGSRAAGITAILLASASVGLGLTMGGKIINRSAADLRPIHETLGLATMVALAAHGSLLLGDSFLRPNVFDLTVPFLLSYDRIYTAIGIICGWGLLLFAASYYLRNRIGVSRQKLIHRFTLLVWVGGLVHAFTEGSDSGEAWFIILMVMAIAPVVFLFAVRIVGVLARRAPTTTDSARQMAA